MSDTEKLAALMRGLEIPPSAAPLSANALYAIGAAIARQAKRSASVDADRVDAIAAEFRRAIPTQAGSTLAAMIEEGVTSLESHIRAAIDSAREKGGV